MTEKCVRKIMNCLLFTNFQKNALIGLSDIILIANRNLSWNFVFKNFPINSTMRYF